MDRRVGVVTGGASGIGLVVADRLREQGWLVESFDLAGDPRSAIGLGPVDVVDEQVVGETVASIEKTLGPIELLVNAAGISEHSAVESLDLASWRRVMGVNLDGAAICMKFVSRGMLARGQGSVVNISSISAERGAPGRAAYCASKAALVALTRVAAVEWASRGISVNAIAPGYVDSPMLHTAVAEGRIVLDEVMARIPSARLVPPSAIAAAVDYLASDAGRFVNGHVLVVDGGFLADYGVGASSVQGRGA